MPERPVRANVKGTARPILRGGGTLSYAVFMAAFAALVGLAPAQAQDPKAWARPAGKVAAKVIPVWPGPAPGSEGWKQKEIEYRNEWDHKAMVRNVTAPTLT